MKKALIAATFAFGFAQVASADGVSDAVIEPEVIEAAAAASSVGAEMFVVMAALIVFAAAAGH